MDEEGIMQDKNQSVKMCIMIRVDNSTNFRRTIGEQTLELEKKWTLTLVTRADHKPQWVLQLRGGQGRYNGEKRRKF